MALISADALAGYLLEEAIAFLLSSNGYRLLQHSDADKQALRQAGHGLLVRGRGADHQADVLGDLLMPTPFSLPVRLFVEAKNRGSKVGLAEVRNAHGVIDDVNQQYSALRTAFGNAGAESTLAGTHSDGTKGGLPEDELASWAARTTAELQDSATGEGLILGFPAAPFILAMHPDSMDDFETSIAEHGSDIRVNIRFGREGPRGDWTITPVEDPEAFRLSFGLPGALETWLLSQTGDPSSSTR